MRRSIIWIIFLWVAFAPLYGQAQQCGYVATTVWSGFVQGASYQSIGGVPQQPSNGATFGVAVSTTPPGCFATPLAISDSPWLLVNGVLGDPQQSSYPNCCQYVVSLTVLPFNDSSIPDTGRTGNVILPGVQGAFQIPVSQTNGMNLPGGSECPVSLAPPFLTSGPIPSSGGEVILNVIAPDVLCSWAVNFAGFPFIQVLSPFEGIGVGNGAVTLKIPPNSSNSGVYQAVEVNPFNSHGVFPNGAYFFFLQQPTLPATAGALNISPAIGDTQTGDVLQPMNQPLTVRVTDQAGNPPTSNVDIRFAVTQQPSKDQFAVFAPANTSTVTVTVPAGRTDAVAQLVLGDSPGSYKVTASCSSNQCRPTNVTFTETAACALKQAAFRWTQSQSHSVPNVVWGYKEYDHSYIFQQAGNVVSPQISETGKLELKEGPARLQLITLSLEQNNLGGLRDKLNRIAGIHAVLTPKTGTLSVYNIGCIRGSNCTPRTDHILTLCDGMCATSPFNLLKPKTLMNVGCALTALAMASNFVGINNLNILKPPANTPSSVVNDPAGLNDFMSKALALPTLGGQFTDEGDVDWDLSTQLLKDNAFIGLPLSFEHLAGQDTAALDNALCIQKLPVVAEVTASKHAHFVLVTGNTGSGKTDGSQYTIADPAGDGTLAHWRRTQMITSFVGS